MKRISIGILALASVAFLFVSPYSLGKTKENYEAFKQTVADYNASVTDLSSRTGAIQSAQSSFDSQRSFEVYYGDVEKLRQVIDGVSSVAITDISVCDPSSQFSVTGSYTEGDSPAAIRVSVTTEDTSAALKIFEKMELPVYKIHIQEPGLIEITFLTGGAF